MSTRLPVGRRRLHPVGMCGRVEHVAANHAPLERSTIPHNCYFLAATREFWSSKNRRNSRGIRQNAAHTVVPRPRSAPRRRPSVDVAPRRHRPTGTRACSEPEDFTRVPFHEFFSTRRQNLNCQVQQRWTSSMNSDSPYGLKTPTPIATPRVKHYTSVEIEEGVMRVVHAFERVARDAKVHSRAPLSAARRRSSLRRAAAAHAQDDARSRAARVPTVRQDR